MCPLSSTVRTRVILQAAGLPAQATACGLCVPSQLCRRDGAWARLAQSGSGGLSSTLLTWVGVQQASLPLDPCQSHQVSQVAHRRDMLQLRACFPGNSENRLPSSWMEVSRWETPALTCSQRALRNQILQSQPRGPMQTGGTSCLLSPSESPSVLHRPPDPGHKPYPLVCTNSILQLLCPHSHQRSTAEPAPCRGQSRTPHVWSSKQPLPLTLGPLCQASSYADEVVLLFGVTHFLENLRKGLDSLLQKCIHTPLHVCIYTHTHIRVQICTHIYVCTHDFCMLTHSLKFIVKFKLRILVFKSSQEPSNPGFLATFLIKVTKEEVNFSI